jgi:hypothetical protein
MVTEGADTEVSAEPEVCSTPTASTTASTGPPDEPSPAPRGQPRPSQPFPQSRSSGTDGKKPLPPPDARPACAATSELATAFTRFAADRCGSYAPLYAHLASRIADDRELLATAAHASPGQSQPDLMLAAVHYLLARQPRSQLARYYPTLNPDPVPPGGTFQEFRRFCLARRDELAALTGSRLVQTNEVRRCCYLLPAVTLAAHLAAPAPLALIEAGASAGLNLGLDGYAYDYGTGTITGDPRSPLTLQCELRGGTPPPLALPAPEIAWRTESTSARWTRLTPMTRPGSAPWSGQTTPAAPASSTAPSAPPRHARPPRSTPETPPRSCPPSSRPPRQTRQSASCTPRSSPTSRHRTAPASSTRSPRSPPDGRSSAEPGRRARPAHFRGQRANALQAADPDHRRQRHRARVLPGLPAG